MTLVSRLVFFGEKKAQEKSSSQIITNEISIVIPVKDNQKGINTYLDYLFASHKQNNLPKEIIIVDNNSKSPVMINDKYHSRGLTIKLLSCNKKGPASARNFGAFHASGKWLLFNDSDCLPTESLFNGYLNADNGSVAYAGNIKALNRGRLSKYYESQEILIPLKIHNDNFEQIPQYLITANTLVWKQSFIEIGGFNESIKIAGGEDIDIGLRLSQIGRLSYALGSIALHDFNEDLIGFLKRFYRYGKGNRIVEELRHTNLRPHLFRPNNRTIFNEIAAKIQFFTLLCGYYSQARQNKKFK